MPESQGGIGIYSNQRTSLALSAFNSELLVTKVSNGEKVILAQEKIPGSGSVFLKYESSKGRYFHFFWSENGTDWIPVKANNEYRVDGTYLAQWGFSPRVGFILDGPKGAAASFTELKIEY
jgi:hypothetical protein